MVKFETGLIFKCKFDSTGNTYKVLKMREDNKMAHIECVDYYAPENLGDNIELYGSGHTVWIASEFFNYLFEKA